MTFPFFVLDIHYYYYTRLKSCKPALENNRFDGYLNVLFSKAMHNYICFKIIKR